MFGVLLFSSGSCNMFQWDFYLQNSEYDQEIPQSQTADKPMTLQGRATRQSQDTRKTN